MNSALRVPIALACIAIAGFTLNKYFNVAVVLSGEHYTCEYYGENRGCHYRVEIVNKQQLDVEVYLRVNVFGAGLGRSGQSQWIMGTERVEVRLAPGESMVLSGFVEAKANRYARHIARVQMSAGLVD